MKRATILPFLNFLVGLLRLGSGELLGESDDAEQLGSELFEPLKIDFGELDRRKLLCLDQSAEFREG